LVATIAAPADPRTVSNPNVRRVAIALAVVLFGFPLLFLAFLIAADPYYLFGSPSIPGFNVVRPYYKPYALAAKPYQVWRRRPRAVVLGPSSSEVGIDPRHPGWKTADVFNFSLPSSNSYGTMLAFLHAQEVGAPLEQAVVNLDFYSYNILVQFGPDFDERRFADKANADFASYLDETRPYRQTPARHIGPPIPNVVPNWNEFLYRAVNQDVDAAIRRGDFKSAREHWELAGRAEHREGSVAPEGWDELGYLQAHPDVASAVARHEFVSGYHHYLAAGRAEGRAGGFLPKDWDEAGYLAANPDAHNLVALGLYRNGFIHYAAIGQDRGYVGGLPPATVIEKLRRHWPGLVNTFFRIRELARLTFSMTTVHDAISTMSRQSEPAAFDASGVRLLDDEEEQMRKLGGVGWLARARLGRGVGPPWLAPPSLQHCFTNMENGVSTFDPFRFMVRRAYAEGTDLRLFTTPLNAAVHQFFKGLDLYERYEFWLRELVRINEEEAARAGRKPLPLWHFGDVNTITSEPIPAADDTTAMRWAWDLTHYRKAAGDMILDRVLDYRDPVRAVPDDFGVRLTSANIDAVIDSSWNKLLDWASANPNFAFQIIGGAKRRRAQNGQPQATCW
jgi:hypothetical protein